MPDLLTDWRSWTNQQELESDLAFPGQAPYTDVEIISNNTAATLAVTGAINTGTTVTLTVASTSYAYGAETQTLQVGQTIGVTGITGFATNNPNGTYAVTAVTPTTVTYVATNAPTGSYSSGGVVQPSSIFAAGTLGTVSVPTYSNVPATVNAVDPFAGWTSQWELPEGTVSISGVSTANPGVVTTASNHNLRNGQTVTIASVGGATQANGTWAVTVLTPTTFSVPVNVTGTYTSGGTVQPDPTERPQVIGLTSDATN